MMTGSNEAILRNMTKAERVVEEINKDHQKACVHCGVIWYKVHHDDGVCPRCQLLGKPGRMELAKRKRSFYLKLAIGAILIGLVIFRVISTLT